VILLGRLSLYGRRAERLHEEIVPVAAKWLELDRRDGPLSVYARDAEAKSLELLEHALGDRGEHRPPEVIEQRLLGTAARDVTELLPQLEQRAATLAEQAVEKLRERGRREQQDLRETLERQRGRVREELERHERELPQLSLDFAEDERRQLEANMRSWADRLGQFERDLEHEPARIADFYEVRARRVEPVGLVYLWPETN